MKASIPGSTALCARCRTPATAAVFSVGAALQQSHRGVAPDGGGRIAPVPFGGFYHLPNCVSRLTVQTQKPVCNQSWQLQHSRFYSKKVHEHFFNPRNAGAFDLSDPEMKKKVGTAIVGKAACGDVIKLQVMVEEGKIKDARFKTFGCGSAIASSSYATELIKGKSCEAALQLKNTDIAEYLNLPPVKVHCSLLAEDAVRHAIKDYQKKQGSAAKESDVAAMAAEARDTARSDSASTLGCPATDSMPSAVSAATAALEEKSTTKAVPAQP